MCLVTHFSNYQDLNTAFKLLVYKCTVMYSVLVEFNFVFNKNVDI